MATPSFGSGPGAVQGREDHEDDAPRREEVEERAYFIYLDEGGGDPAEHWLRAERELKDSSRTRAEDS